MRRIILPFLLIVLLAGAPTLATAQEASPAPAGGSLLAQLGYPEIRVTSDGTGHDFPAEIEAGRYHVVLENTSDLGIDLEFIQLPEGITPDEVNAAFAEAEESPVFVPPAFFYDMVFNGGPRTFPGETSSVVLDLTPGEWYINLYTYNPETEEETETQSAFTVTGEMPAIEEPADIVEIGLVDMDFRVSEALTAGPQLWRVESNGLQIHHLVLTRVPDGTTEDDVMELASVAFAPPPSASPAAGATPMMETALAFEDVEDVFGTLLFSYGQFNIYELNLEPGTYAMICSMPDPSGTPHVLLGMVEIVVVE